MAHPFRLHRCVVIATLVAASLGAAPAAAQHRARLSADLAGALVTGSPSIDVIVHGDRASVDATAARHSLRVQRYLKSGAVFRLTAGQLAALQQDETYDHLSSDIRITASDVTTETIEAEGVWTGVGAIRPSTGAGIGVAVIDSGVDFNHAALKGRVVVSVDFTGGNGVDRYGHGTHVAATIAGQAGVSADTLAYRGVASSARIVNLRVLGDDGSGTASSVIEAIDWAIDNRARYNIRVINLSLGAPVLQPYRDDPLCEAAERAVAAGIVVVAAAGNHGVTADGRTIFGGITTPGNDPGVLTVGALDAHATSDRSDDTVAAYSSRGPSMYDLVLKPDLVAPGSHIVSAEAPGSYLATKHPDHYVAGSGEGSYMQLSGTSMAAAVASGAVALLIDEQPRFSPSEVKVALQVTSSLLPAAGLLASGAGSLNAFAAVEFADGKVHAAFGATTDSAPEGQSATAPDTTKAISSNRATVIAFGVAEIRGRATLWGKTAVAGQAFVWSRPLNTIVPQRATLKRSGANVVGECDDDTIIWGQSEEDTIIWGQSEEDTIIWGQSEEDTIIWGQSEQDTSWGQNEEGTTFWGQNDEDTIIWGQ